MIGVRAEAVAPAFLKHSPRRIVHHLLRSAASRAFSRIDCCARMGAIEERRMARMCPGVARPRRSPHPADFFKPSGRGTRNEKISRSAAAFSGVVSHSVRECPSILIFCDDP